MGAPIEAVVCIPSFRRPDGLRRTLASLEADGSDVRFAVVVIDNDARDRQALAVAEEVFATGVLDGHAELETQQGNVHAINAAFSTAIARYPEARYLLMVDDDEAVRPGWLAAMIAAAQDFDAAIVGGPVRRRFSGAVPDGFARHPLFRSIETATGPIDIIHGSGNCLIAREVFETLGAPFFDARFNMLGGGDMDFFTRARAAGFRFAWAGEAVIDEDVGTERLTALWLMQRSLRTGAINYGIDRKQRPGVAGWLLLAGKNVVSLGRGVLRFGAAVASPSAGLLPASHWLIMPVGRVLGSFGWSPTPLQGQIGISRHWAARRTCQ